MTELKKFATLCHELCYDEETWLHEFHAEWIDSEGHAKFRLKNNKATATVEWDDSGFTIRIAGPSVIYYESCRSVETAEQALNRVSTMLCE
jgi:hypothetical protein